jgi:hypothetical protein
MRISKKIAKELFIKYKINESVVKPEEWHYGINVELEHGSKLNIGLVNVTNDDLDMTAKIVQQEKIRNYTTWLRGFLVFVNKR